MNFRIIEYVLERRRIIGWVSLLAVLLSLAWVLLSDPKYSSKALLMPPLEEGGEGLLSAWAAKLNLPAMVIPMAAGATTAEILVDILESRRLAEMVISSQGLMEWYGTESVDEAVRELGARISTSASATGLITLKVTERDPDAAYRIASALIAGLDSLNHDLQFTRAENTMAFVSQQLERYRSELETLRGEIADFQMAHGIVDFGEQVRGAIDVAATLKVSAVLAEINRDLLKEYARDDALDLRRADMEYRSLEIQLEKLMRDDSSSGVFIPLEKMPALHQEYARMQRDLDVNERVYSFLLERYEDSGIDRARNTPSVQVIDPPNIPERRAGMPRWAVVLISGLAGAVWSAVMIAWVGWIAMRERGPGEKEAYDRVVGILQNDVAALRRWLRL